MLFKHKILSDFIVAFIVGTSLFFSCNSSVTKEKSTTESKNGTESSNSYFPVNNGNKWQYINEAPRDESDLINVNIEAVKAEGKNLVVELSAFPFFSGNSEKSKLVFKNNGQVFSINKDGIEELFLESSDNLKQSNKWKYGQWDAYVGSTNDEVKAEKETYKNCIYISFSQFYTFSAEMWLAKDVGVVKWGYNRTNPPTLKPLYYVLNNLTLEK